MKQERKKREKKESPAEMKLFFKNFVKLMIILIVIVSIAVAVVFNLSVNALEDEVKTMTQHTADEYAHRVTEILEQSNRLTTYLAVDERVQTFFNNEHPEYIIDNYFNELRGKLRVYSYGIRYIDSIIAYAPKHERLFTDQGTRSLKVTDVQNDAGLRWDWSWIPDMIRSEKTTTQFLVRTHSSDWPYYITVVKHFRYVTQDGAIALDINLDTLYETLAVNRAAGSELYMFDTDGSVILRADKRELRANRDDFPQLASYRAEGAFCKLFPEAEEPYAYAQSPVGTYGFVIGVTAPISDYMTRLLEVRSRCVWACVIMGIFAAIVAAIYGMLSIRPLQAIQQLLENPAAWQQNGRRAEEIRDIADRIIGFLQTNDRLRGELDQRLNLLNRVQMQALQAQINPHFLFNTLNMISLRVELGDAHAADMLDELANILRYSLSESEQTPIREEVSYAERYIDLLSAQYENFHPIIDISPELMDCSILKLSLQPLIENALRHGISACLTQRAGYLWLTIRACGYAFAGGAQQPAICIEVRDNGIGIPPDKLEMLRAQMNDHADIATEHIGLANVARRYYLTFHDMQRVTIDSTVDEGTVVRLIYPRRID